jgi:superfamily II DNA or RNA helicase
VQIDRHNAWARIRRAPTWFLEYLTRHLAVPVEPGTELGQRFGVLFDAEGQRWGSLVKGDVVAAGLVPHVESLARHYGLPAHVVDHRVRPEEQFPLQMIRASWRPYQDDVQRQLLAHPVGIVDAPPRSGKTLMMGRIIDALALRSVVIAPSVQIVRQTYEVLVRTFGDDAVSRIDGEATDRQRDPERQIVVATPNSALSLPESWWDTRELLVVDEFHHSAADSYHRINALARNAFYRYGFTGTHFRTGDDRLAMEAVCSTVLYRIPVDYLVANGWLATPRVTFATVGAKPTGGHDYPSAYQRGIVDCDERNDLVVHIARTMISNDVPTIVLTRRRAHADALAARIPDALAVKGGENALTSRTVRDFLEGRFMCLVGTTVIGEGVDVPRAGALVFASGGNDGVAMMQSYFRPLTAAPGKAVGRIFDFVDSHHGLLRKHSTRRIEMAREQLGAARILAPEGV